MAAQLKFGNSMCASDVPTNSQLKMRSRLQLACYATLDLMSLIVIVLFCLSVKGGLV